MTAISEIKIANQAWWPRESWQICAYDSQGKKIVDINEYNPEGKDAKVLEFDNEVRSKGFRLTENQLKSINTAMGTNVSYVEQEEDSIFKLGSWEFKTTIPEPSQSEYWWTPSMLYAELSEEYATLNRTWEILTTIMGILERIWSFVTWIFPPIQFVYNIICSIVSFAHRVVSGVQVMHKLYVE